MCTVNAQPTTKFTVKKILDRCGNDPSVGEPAEGSLPHRSKIFLTVNLVVGWALTVHITCSGPAGNRLFSISTAPRSDYLKCKGGVGEMGAFTGYRLAPPLTKPNLTYNFQRWMSRFPQR